jgi:hypothetical protein
MELRRLVQAHAILSTHEYRRELTLEFTPATPPPRVQAVRVATSGALSLLDTQAFDARDLAVRHSDAFVHERSVN